MMDNSLADMLRITTANMTELMNRIADHVEHLEYKVKKLEQEAVKKESNDQVSR
jgi:hypothetical protein